MFVAGIEDGATESVATKSSWLATEMFSLTVVFALTSGTIATGD